jgi:hypothetical protein
MSNIILYSVYLPNLSDENHHNQQIFSQLYTSLKTLYNTGYSGNVFLCYDSDVDISKFVYKKKYNLLQDFNKLIYVNFKYNNFLKTTTKAAFHKWNAVKYFNDNFSFDKILCVDNDTIFTKNPSYFFEKYFDSNLFYGIKYEYDSICEKIGLIESCINTGQFLISKNILNHLNKNFLQNLLKEYIEVLITTNKTEPERADHMIWLGEEYAITKLLQNNDITIQEFSDTDVRISTIGNDATLYHYYSSNTKIAVPQEYWSTYTKNTSKDASYNFLS